MFDEFLANIGLSDIIPISKTPAETHLVSEALADTPGELMPQEVHALYTYDVPSKTADAACSIAADTVKYSLTAPYGLAEDWSALQRHPQTLRLWRLGRVVKELHAITGADWLGIYRTVRKSDGSSALLKEAYQGSVSRAEFPLTEEFARQSNNSTVGLTGRARLVNDVEAYNGPYYNCDARVWSELCVPILNSTGEVIGIIDAESFRKNHFTPARMALITGFCYVLGQWDQF